MVYSLATVWSGVAVSPCRSHWWFGCRCMIQQTVPPDRSLLSFRVLFELVLHRISVLEARLAHLSNLKPGLASPFIVVIR